MALNNDDLGKLEQLMDKRDEKLVGKMNQMEERIFGEMNKRDETLLKKMERFVSDGSEKVVAKTEALVNERDQKMLDKMSAIMDERMLLFHEKVTEPMIDNVVEMLRGEISDVGERIEIVENNTYRIEKKLDNISDHHSKVVDNHEKRIVTLERKFAVSL